MLNNKVLAKDQLVVQMMTWYWVEHLCASGIEQMALDEALLEWVQMNKTTPVLVVRTYEWRAPTLSFGVHQKGPDAHQAYRRMASDASVEVVRRPTGGRAILHGEDVSFAFVTNVPEILKMSLAESYCFFTAWVKQALEASGIPLTESCTQDKKAYLRSPLCFETQTPSDLLTQTGQKVAGSAQLRRQGGLLQHGAAFLNAHNIPALGFSGALQDAVQIDLGKTSIVLRPQESEELQTLWLDYQKRYTEEERLIRAKLAMTSGSHFVPASD